METETMIPLRLGLRFRPPSLALEYKRAESGEVELLEMAVATLTDESTADELLVDLQKDYGEALSPGTISVKQVKRLLQMLVDNKKSQPEKVTSGVEEDEKDADDDASADEEEEDEAPREAETEAKSDDGGQSPPRRDTSLDDYEEDDEIDDEIDDESGDIEFDGADDDDLEEDSEQGYTFD